MEFIDATGNKKVAGHVAWVEAVRGDKVIVSEMICCDDINKCKPNSGGPRRSKKYLIEDFNKVNNEGLKGGFIHINRPPSGNPPASFGFSTKDTGPECSETTPQIRLTWTPSSGADFYQVYRNGIILDGVSGTSYLDTNVTLGKTYNYYVKAINSAGQKKSNSSPSIIARCDVKPGVFTLRVIPWCDENAPVNKLEWTGSAGRTLPYEIYRDGSLISTTDFNYDDKDVVAGTTYSYFVRAKNSFGDTDSNTITVTTKSDCAAPLAPIIDDPQGIYPQTVTIGDGDFTLTVTGRNFDETCKILWNFAGSEPSAVIYPTYVNSTTLTVGVSQNSAGFSPFSNPGSMVIQVLKPGPNFWDGQRSNIVYFKIYNPYPVISSISGNCQADLNCTPSNGFDVHIYGGGFVNNITYTGNWISSTYAEINGNPTPISPLGQGPVYNELQLYVNGSLIPTPGTYTIKVCNAGTEGEGTSCSTGYLTVTP